MISMQVKLAFLDDRQTKKLFDEKEKARRIARAAAAQEAVHPESPHSAHPKEMPGSGHILLSGDLDSDEKNALDEDADE